MSKLSENWREWPPEAKRRFLDRLRATPTPGQHSRPLTLGPYHERPADYARAVLGVEWWAKQREAAEALLRPPHRVLLKSGHTVGKTNLLGGLVNWWHDSFNPSICLTTAPTDRQVDDLLWKEVRIQRRGRAGLLPKASRLESAPDHFAHGFTARDGEAFQGHHGEKVLVIFDEAVGVDPIFWETAATMATHWICAFNPNDTTSQAYLEEHAGGWTVIEIPSTSHPNIELELRGEAPLIPGAVRLGWIEDRIRRWCTPIPAEEHVATDVQWRPAGTSSAGPCWHCGREDCLGSHWWRPGPIAEARIFARWPSLGTYGVWSDALWSAALAVGSEEPMEEYTEIGCDPALFGDDFTAIHVRRGPVSLHHESANGWTPNHVAGRLKQLAREHAARMIRLQPAWSDILKPEDIPVKVDADGPIGVAVLGLREEYNFIPISAAADAVSPEYRNRRTELWFHVADLAREGKISLARLPRDVLQELRRQAMAPRWQLNKSGQMEVEEKKKTKENLKRSPDDMDALNLAYWGFFPHKYRPAGRETAATLWDRARDSAAADTWSRRARAPQSAAGRRGLFGR